MKTLLTVPEFCAALGLGRDHVYKLVRSGDIHRIPGTRRVLIPSSELEAFPQRCAAPQRDRVKA